MPSGKHRLRAARSCVVPGRAGLPARYHGPGGSATEPPVDDFTPEELRLAERLLDERLRSASRERYRQLVERKDPALNRGPVTVPPEEAARLRAEVAAEVRAGRTPRAPSVHRRWPWQRR